MVNFKIKKYKHSDRFVLKNGKKYLLGLYNFNGSETYKQNIVVLETSCMLQICSDTTSNKLFLATAVPSDFFSKDIVDFVDANVNEESDQPPQSEEPPQTNIGCVPMMKGTLRQIPYFTVVLERKSINRKNF